MSLKFQLYFFLVLVRIAFTLTLKQNVVAHRGASGYLPEHSLAAYRLAIDLQADYVEIDLSLTKDRILVCIHDPILDPTTNIESFPEFDTRVQTHIINGKSFTGHFIRDFTSHEIQQLTVKQRYPETRSTAHDSLLRVPSFSDVLNLVKMEYERSGRPVGIFAELKHPSWYNEGKAEHFMEDLFTQQLTDSGISTLRSSNMTNLLDFFETPTPLIVECFEPAPLQYLKKTSSLPLVQLLPSEVEQQWLDPSVNNRDLSVLEHIATYAHGIGPHKSFFGDLPYAVAKQLVGDVKRLSLSIHPYTFHTDRAISAERGGFKQAVIGIDRYGNSSNDNSSSSSSNGSSSNCSITNSSISSNISSSSSSHPPLKATCHSIVAEGTAERSGVGDSVGYPPGSGSCIPTQSSSASDKKRTDEMEEEMYFLCCLEVDGIFSESPDRSRATLLTMEILALTNPSMPCGINCDTMF